MQTSCGPEHRARIPGGLCIDIDTPAGGAMKLVQIAAKSDPLLVAAGQPWSATWK